MKPIISVRDLGKMYRIRSEEKKRYLTLRDELAEGFRKLWHGKSGQSQVEEFWALKDINFDIYPGEVVGIIGRNGAGKSTLLKILSRITPPTKGEAILGGRVGSLLEVGTGFHPELTGRENIFLSGAILGMSRAEIRKKFDEIVAFAEVEKFIDTPVKRYSSGMYVRLAFGVAAHLEPEILIVDEVLAVGDAQFQKKCLGKMEDVAKGGRTVLFVSHQMAAIQNLCKKAIWLDKGQLAIQDKTEKVINQYLAKSTNTSKISLSDRKDRKGDGKIRFTLVDFQNSSGESNTCFYSGQDIKIILFFVNNVQKNIQNLSIAIGIDNQLGDRITNISTEAKGSYLNDVDVNKKSIIIEVYKLPLTPGRYGLTIFSMVNGTIADWIQSAAFFEVEGGDFYGTGKLPHSMQGNFLMNYEIEI